MSGHDVLTGYWPPAAGHKKAVSCGRDI